MRAGIVKRISMILVLILCVGTISWAEEGKAPEAVVDPTVSPTQGEAPEAVVNPTVSPTQGATPEAVVNPTVSPTQEAAAPAATPGQDTALTEEQLLKAQQEQQQQDQQAKEAVGFKEAIDKMVQKRIGNFYKAGGKGTIGIYIKELGTNFSYGYNEAKTENAASTEGYFKTASTCKLLSAAVMYYLNNKKELILDKKYTDKISKAVYNLKSLLFTMISHSVNEYFNITLRHLGGQKINETLKELGTKNSYVYSEIGPAPYTSGKANLQRYGIVRSPRTTPEDLGHILELIYEGKTFGAENDKRFADSLKANIYSNRLPMGIGYRSPVGHKTGTSPSDGVYNDAGIVYLKDNPYIMVVMSRGSGSSVQAMYRSLAKDVYEYMKERAEKNKTG